MRSTATFIFSRRFLQVRNASLELRSQPPTSASSDIGASADGSMTFNPTTPFDSSMALTILVLLSALFFMGFFSVYIRRLSMTEDAPSPPSRAPPPQGQKLGLDPSAVSSLPLAAYGKAIKHPMIEDCPICLGEFSDRETVKVIPYCGHVFHPRCVDTWLSAHVTCPLCRTAQLFKSGEEEDVEERLTAREKHTCTEEESSGV